MPKANQEWYLFKNGQRYGPYTWEQLQAFLRENRLLVDDLLWSHSLSTWTPAKQVPGLLTQSSGQSKAASKEGVHRSPKGKKKPFVLGGFLLILLIVGGVLAFNALWGNGNVFSGDTTLEAVTCREVTDESEAVEAVDSFNQEGQEIYLAVLVNDAQEGIILTADWWYLPPEGGNENGDESLDPEGAYGEKVFLVGYERELSRGDNRTHFSIRRPPYDWKTGDYQVTLELDQDPALTVPFRVE